MSKPPKTEPGPSGFDAPIRDRRDDYLNRWPFAREIYGIATTGPQEWSVRVGVYGEWGAGKTSVLKFVSGMAAKDLHIVIWFDPWEHSTRPELWRAFVLKVFQELKAHLGRVKGSRLVGAKAWAAKSAGVVAQVAKIAHDRTGQALSAGLGLDLVKRHLCFSQRDLASLREALGERRVIVLIDDLDRTAPESVPEILLALKELMDIPHFSFICAFDPHVVGQVLARYHPGFGDDLKFLEKIIDYPRWLPEAGPDGLARLAVADARRFCPYVPEDALRDATPLLPRNPRAVRQFIRLLALLGPQIGRHRNDELQWPMILYSNVLKVGYPRIARPLLKNADFWRDVEHADMFPTDPKEEGDLDKRMTDCLDRALATQARESPDKDKAQREQILRILRALRSSISVWEGADAKSLAYQADIAEAPRAVTQKEFDELFAAWRATPACATIEAWMSGHSSAVERDGSETYDEALAIGIDRYASLDSHGPI